MAKPSREMSLIEEHMRTNIIFESWTGQWGVKIRPVFSIDKLQFSFIEKGSSGKGRSFDVLMDTLRDDKTCFDDWASEILNGAFLKRMSKADGVYQYETGDNAALKINIEKSTKNDGYVINGVGFSKDGKKSFCYIPVTYHGLRKLAERYKVAIKPRLEQLEEFRLEAERKETEEREKYRASKGNKETKASDSKDSKESSSSTNAVVTLKTFGVLDGSEPAILKGKLYKNASETYDDEVKVLFYRNQLSKKSNKDFFNRLEKNLGQDKHFKISFRASMCNKGTYVFKEYVPKAS